MSSEPVFYALFGRVLVGVVGDVVVLGSIVFEFFWLSSYLVWVGVKFSNAKEEELLINDASQIGSKKFDFSIE